VSVTTPEPAAETDLARCPVAAGTRPAADLVVRRLLRVDRCPVDTSADGARSTFSRSMVISGVRCALTYVILPFLAPLLGVAAGVGPWLGLPLGVVAITFNVLSIRRFFAADHPRRWVFAALSVSVIGLLLVLMAQDLLALAR
jgi:hypothetical protein